MTPVGIALAVLILLLVAFMVRSGLKRPEPIVLPPESTQDSTQTDAIGELNAVEIRSDTVQAAIAALERDRVYTRRVTIERFWNGGSATAETTVSVADGWTRLVTVRLGDATRHTILTDDGQVYIWYGSERRYYHSTAAFSQDDEQEILTYEDILALPVEAITAADYRTLDEKPCIYVETAADTDDYVQRYWVSTQNGLLIAAEREQEGELVYRMYAEELTASAAENDFTLPDGTVLYMPPTEAQTKSADES